MAPETLTGQAPPVRSRNRGEIPDRFKWNVHDIFPDWEGWDAAYKQLEAGINKYAELKGTLAQGPGRLLEAFRHASLLEIHLETGRTHQIRVHMAHLGHPLLGDGLYGGADLAGMNRQALHAWRLAFVHPFTGQSLVWRADLPADMAQALQALGLRYNGPH